jgi:hypothetical protein
VSAEPRKSLPENQLFADAMMLAAADVVSSQRALTGDQVFDIVRDRIRTCLKAINEAARQKAQPRKVAR